jgi:hypothetical protein
MENKEKEKSNARRDSQDYDQIFFFESAIEVINLVFMIVLCDLAG